MRRRDRDKGAGILDQRIIVKREARVDDGYGGYAKSFTTVGTIWARVVPVRGSERVIADHQAGTQTYMITVRNDGTGASIVVADVITWQGQDLNVRTAPIAGRKQYRLVEAESNVTT